MRFHDRPATPILLGKNLTILHDERAGAAASRAGLQGSFQ